MNTKRRRLRLPVIVAGVAAVAGAVIALLWSAMHQAPDEPGVAFVPPATESQKPAPATEAQPPALAAESEAPALAAPVVPDTLADTKPPPGRYVAASATTPSAPDEARSQVALLRFSVEAAAAGPVTFMGLQPRSRPVPTRRREMPLGMGRLEVVVEDRERNPLWRTVIADPRVVRGEFFGLDGNIEQSVTIRRDAMASIVYPQDDRAYRLIVSEPVAYAGEMELRPIADLALQ